MKTSLSVLVVIAVSALIMFPQQSTKAQTTSSSSSSSYSSSSSSGPGGTTYSSTSSSVTFRDTPLLESLTIVSQTTRTAIFVSTNAATVLNKSSHKVTISEQNLSPEELFAKILKGTQLVAVPIGSNVCILTEQDSVEELKANVAAAIKAKTEVVKGLIPLAVIHTDNALRSPIQLTMVQTPVPFVIQMLEGLGRVRIVVPSEYRDQFFVQQPLISIRAQGEPLGTVLQSVAKQIGCELDVSEGVIAIRKPAASAAR